MNAQRKEKQVYSKVLNKIIKHAIMHYYSLHSLPTCSPYMYLPQCIIPDIGCRIKASGAANWVLTKEGLESHCNFKVKHTHLLW